MSVFYAVLDLQPISRDVTDNVSHPRQLDPTIELITYSIVLSLQHGRHDVKCKPSKVFDRIPVRKTMKSWNTKIFYLVNEK